MAECERNSKASTHRVVSVAVRTSSVLCFHPNEESVTRILSVCVSRAGMGPPGPKLLIPGLGVDLLHLFQYICIYVSLFFHCMT